MKKFFTLFSLLFLLNSCGLIVMNGLSDDYNKLNEQQKEMVVSFRPNLPTDENKIYVINAPELKTELKKYPKALVYTFANACSSEFCKPLYFYENWAKRNDYKIFLIMASYANIEETLSQNCKNQLYVIDSNYYGNGPFGKHVTCFDNELQGLDRNAKDKTVGNLFFFENGEFVKNLRELPKG